MNYGDGEAQGYTFDAMGNRMSKTDNVTGNETYAYNNANMLLSRNGQAYTYDLNSTTGQVGNGNQLTGGGRVNTWDAENRLITSVYNGKKSTYTYGADGLRRSAQVRNVSDNSLMRSTTYVLDGQNVVQDITTAGTTVTTRTYLPGPTGATGCTTRVHATSDGSHSANDTVATRWYLYDGLGSVIGECDESGNITTQRSFDVYGAVRYSWSDSGENPTRNRFCGSLGHVQDDENGGLIYMRARYMDPVTGRFISEDPAYKGFNWYIYCRDNPTNILDQSGKDGSLGEMLTSIGASLGLDISGFAEVIDDMLQIGIDKVEKTVAEVAYDKLAASLVSMAEGTGAKGMIVWGYIASRGGEAFMESLGEALSKSGDVSLDVDGTKQWLVLMFGDE